MSTIYISHGDKGGIGKSYLATAIADTLLLANPEKLVIVIDGDSGETEGKNNADVGPRFKDHPRVFSTIAPLNNPKRGIDAIYKAMDEIYSVIEETGDQSDFDIVINTPANFGHTFDKETQKFFQQLADDTGMNIKILYTVGQTALARSSAYDFVKESVFDQEQIILALPTKETEESQWLSDKTTAGLVKNKLAFLVPKMSYELINLFDGNPNKSLGFFFSSDSGFDPASLGFRDKLKYRMVKNHSDEISEALNGHLID